MNKPGRLKDNSWYSGTNKSLKPAIGTDGRVIQKYKNSAGMKIVIFKTAEREYMVPADAVDF